MFIWAWKATFSAMSVYLSANLSSCFDPMVLSNVFIYCFILTLALLLPPYHSPCRMLPRGLGFYGEALVGKMNQSAERDLDHCKTAFHSPGVPRISATLSQSFPDKSTALVFVRFCDPIKKEFLILLRFCNFFHLHTFWLTWWMITDSKKIWFFSTDCLFRTKLGASFNLPALRTS